MLTSPELKVFLCQKKDSGFCSADTDNYWEMVFSLASVESNSSYATNNNPYLGKSVFQDRHKCDKCELRMSPYSSEINLLL